MKNLSALFLLFFVVRVGAQEDNFTIRWVQLRDTMKVAYVDEGSGPQTLLFVHGLGSYHKAWNPNVRALSAQYRCIAVDLPGYGDSDHFSGEYSMDFFAEVLAGFIEALGLESVTLVGHSMGGQIAMHLALSSPGSLQNLVLIAPAGFELFSEQEKNWFAQVYTPAWVASATPDQIRQNFRINFFRMPEDVGLMIDDRIALIGQPGFEAYCAMIPRCVQAMLNAPVLDRLPALALPTLIIFGAEDMLIPNRFLHPGQRTLQIAETGRDAIPGARLVMIPEAGHFVQWEKAATVNQAILDFLKN